MSVKVMSWVFDEAECTLATRLVLLAMADCAHDDGTNAYPSMQLLADKAKVSKRTARYAVRQLERQGYVRPTGTSPFGTTIYAIQMGVQKLPGADIAGRQISAQNVSQIAPEPSVNPSKRSSSKEELLDSQVSQVFDFWRTTLSKNGATKLTKARRRRITARLRDDGYGVDALKRAIVGCAASRWHTDRGHTDIELICRDAPHVDRFIHLAGDTKPGDSIIGELAVQVQTERGESWRAARFAAGQLIREGKKPSIDDVVTRIRELEVAA